MSGNLGVQRDALNADSFRLTAGRCTFTYRRVKPGVLLLTIAGDDVGQFGTTTLDEITAESERFGAVALFVDTLGASGPATKVMEMWTAYFTANRKRLKTVSILIAPESKLLHLTVSIAQHLSGIGGLLQIFDSRDQFNAAIRRETPSFVE